MGLGRCRLRLCVIRILLCSVRQVCDLLCKVRNLSRVFLRLPCGLVRTYLGISQVIGMPARLFHQVTHTCPINHALCFSSNELPDKVVGQVLASGGLEPTICRVNCVTGRRLRRNRHVLGICRPLACVNRHRLCQARFALCILRCLAGIIRLVFRAF